MQDVFYSEVNKCSDCLGPAFWVLENLNGETLWLILWSVSYRHRWNLGNFPCSVLNYALLETRSPVSPHFLDACAVLLSSAPHCGFLPRITLITYFLVHRHGF